MLIAVFVLLVIGGFAWYVSTPAERTRLASTLVTVALRAVHVATVLRASLAPFHDALRSRTRVAVVVPLLGAVGVGLFVLMAIGSARLGDPETLVAWGASFGPRTTNGEWWRLAAMLSVHGGLLHLLVNTAALVQVGLLLERLVGSAAVAAVYLLAGLAAGLVDLAVSPVGVGAGSAGAIAGLYGLLFLAWGWTQWPRSGVTVPWRALVVLAPAAALFALYNLNAGWIGRQGQYAGLAVGIASGLVLGAGLPVRKPALRRSFGLLAVGLVALLAIAFPLRGLTDPRQPLRQLVAAEDRTAALYGQAVRGFTGGRRTAAWLADVIEKAVVPELQAAGGPVTTLRGVPREYQPPVSAAEEYLRLRVDGWRVRAAALRGGSLGQLRDADRMERASLQALEPVRSALSGAPARTP